MNHHRYLILISIFLTSIFSSCIQSNERKNNVIIDSLIKATENIAIGETKFGISEKEFNQLHPDSLIILEGNIYTLTSFFNKSKKLNMIYLMDTVTVDNTKFDKELFNRMDLLKQHFVKTYGEPQQDRGYPKQAKMKNGKAFEAYKWEIGKKLIAVGIALEETDEGNIYYVLAHVDRKE
ncbi:hypothetical protein [Pedobacter helvus]|uniref:Lipoprotein n=1 Tax=Pedobacter helvus TaxID=2563444 RepID=A0ABW9JMY0_9SPHI|nr:hypothetical protein [Pedobacter ureilyticus]